MLLWISGVCLVIAAFGIALLPPGKPHHKEDNQ